MSGTLKLSGALKIGSLASAPSNPEVGFSYYDSTLGAYRQWDGSQWVEQADFGQLSSTANGEGASLIGIEDSGGIITATTVEGALAEIQGDLDTAESSLSSHLNGGASKHDANEVDYERVDGSKKNIQATSDDVESALSDLDDAIGTLNQGSNYTASNAAEVGSHLDAIDDALATAGGTDFNDSTFRVSDNTDNTKKIALEASGITTATVRTITMPDSDVNLGDIATNNAKVSADGSVTSHSDVTDAGSGAIITSAERSKLSGIEAGADVTDSANVDAAGAVMNSDTSTAAMSFVIDEDNMASDSATKVPTQQSVKAYVDSVAASEMSYKGGYDAATNSPDLDSTPIATAVGDMYTVTAAGTFFTTSVEVGDTLISEVANATTEADWTIVQANLTPASIKTQYESNSDTNAFTDAEKTLLGNQSGTNTGDEPAASTTVAGVAEIATAAEIDTGTDDTRTISPLGLANSQLQSDVTTNNAKVGYTAAQAKADVVNDSITDGNTDTAPSENAVFDALAGKLANVVEDTTPQLGGDLDLNGNALEDASNDVVIAGANSIKRAKQASKASFIEEEYIHAITLTASQTNAVIADLTFAHASIEGLEICYKMKEATSNNVRIGTIRVVTNGTDVELNDLSLESADLGVTFDAVVNGANINVRYTSDTNNVTMRADVKKFLA